MAILGTDYLIWIDTVSSIDTQPASYANFRPIVCGKGNDFSLGFEAIEFRNKCDGGWVNSRPGYGSWSLSLDGHAVGLKRADQIEKANFQEVTNLAMDKRTFWAAMMDLDKTIVRLGLVWINSIGESANLNEPYSFNVSFTGIKKPILSTEFYTLVLATHPDGIPILEDGKDNLIKVNMQGQGVPSIVSADTWNDNSTWGG